MHALAVCTNYVQLSDVARVLTSMANYRGCYILTNRFSWLVVLTNDSCCICIVSCSYRFLHIIIDGFYDFVALAVFVDLTMDNRAQGVG